VKEACERSIILAAAGVAKLREPDVTRVMEDYFYAHGSTSELVDYIVQHRPDLASEANACQLELVPVTKARPGPSSMQCEPFSSIQVKGAGHER
jgi:hypothetical protein